MHSIKLTLNVLVFFYVISFLLSCTSDNVLGKNLYSNLDLTLVEQNDWTISNDILHLINNHRVKEGKTILLKDTLYATAYAVKHSKYMISKASISHDYFYLRSDGLKQKGAIRVSENLAYGYTSAQSVVNAWLKSTPHKKVIEGDYLKIGFGVLKSDDKLYFTTLYYK